LPPGTAHTLSVLETGGGAAVAFEGAVEPEECRRFYRRWFAEQGYTAMGRWQPSEDTWLLRFTAPPGGPVAAVDVRLGRDARGRLSGLLLATPAADERRGGDSN
jgi:hypothetical protein